MTCLNQKRLTSWAINKTRGTKNSSPAFYYTCGRSCGARVRRRRKEKHELVSIDIISCLRRRALTMAERVALAARRVPPTYLRSQRDVPTRWWGRSYGCGEELPPERQQLPWRGIAARLVVQEAGVWRSLQCSQGLAKKIARQKHAKCYSPCFCRPDFHMILC